MIILENDRLEFRFPDVHEAARCSIEFQRTLRIPDDGKDYPLPPGLGSFPLRHVDDHAARLPEAWRRRGGVMTPMHQAEALWISFHSRYPFAVKVATGKVCAITGDSWVDHLNNDPQDYVVLPDQPWLDGYCVEKGIIRQFVAMPMGEGYTVEEQLTGAAQHGGVQIVAYPMKAERYEALFRGLADSPAFGEVLYSESPGMGLAPGGRMHQHIEEDEHGLKAWDQRHGSRCFVSIVNTAQWMAITGERPPTEPPTTAAYTAHGLPWFEYYGSDLTALPGSEKLKGLSSIAQHAKATGKELPPGNETIAVPHVVGLGGTPRRQVREPTANEAWA